MCLFVFINPFQAKVLILYSLKTPEIQRFSGVFSQGYKMWTLARNIDTSIKKGNHFICSLMGNYVDIFLIGMIVRKRQAWVRRYRKRKLALLHQDPKKNKQWHWCYFNIFKFFLPITGTFNLTLKIPLTQFGSFHNFRGIQLHYHAIMMYQQQYAKTTGKQNFNPFSGQFSLSILPENTRKPEVFWCFQGGIN